MTSFEPSGQADQVKSTGRFVKMSVSPRRNDQFAAESESPSPFLNDVNEEIDGLETIGTQGTRSSQVEKVIKPSDHGLVLLDPLFVTALIHEVAKTVRSA